MEWPDMVRWHRQHQRVQEELHQVTAMRDQVAQLSAIVGSGPAPSPPALPATDLDEDYEWPTTT